MKYFLLLLCAGWSLCSAAQNKTRNFSFKTAVNFNPVLMIGEDITAMMGVEHHLNNKLALVMDMGYVLQSDYFNGRRVMKGASGFNFRPGIKLYKQDRKQTYWAAQMFYKQVDYKMYDWLGKSCVNDIPTYEQLQEFTYRKKVVSINFMAGQFYHISNKLLLELYGGLGVKFKSQMPTEERSCYRNNERGFLSKFQEKITLPNVPVGVKLVYIIR